MENTTKTKVIKTYQNHILDVGMFPCPLTLSDGGKRLRLASSWSLLLGPYTWSKVHKSPCVGGDDPPTIRNTRILHPGSTSRIKKHELAAPWSMRVFLHCAFLWRQCQLLVQLSNVSDSKQILHLSIGKLEKTVEQFETSLDESNFRSFKIWQWHNLCKPIVTGRALAALAARKFKMLSMPWQNDTARGEVGFGFTRCIKTLVFWLKIFLLSESTATNLR